MKIGIDIDDTITDTWEMMIPYYVELFKVDEEALRRGNPYYEGVKDRVAFLEYCEAVKPVTEKVVLDIPLKKEVALVINKLHDMGYTIIFITSRSSVDTDSPYDKTAEYLNQYQIKYDKLITSVRRKDMVCLEEGIDLFIDDSNKHCDEVKNVGIDVLMFETEYNKNNLKHRHVTSWKEIEDYLLRGNRDEK